MLWTTRCAPSLRGRSWGPLELNSGRLADRCAGHLVGLDSENFQAISRMIRAAFYVCHILYIDGAPVDRAAMECQKVHAEDLLRCSCFLSLGGTVRR